MLKIKLPKKCYYCSRSGVDYNIANVLASLDTHVILEYGNLKGGNPAIDRLNAKYLSCKFAFLQLNLANLLSIQKFIAGFKKR